MNLGTELPAVTAVPIREKSASPLCSKDALTDDFGWSVQAVLACLAFACLVRKFNHKWMSDDVSDTIFFCCAVKRFCEPASRRRSWLVWFYDTSKQGLGSLVIHFANIYLATLFQGDPCTWCVSL